MFVLLADRKDPNWSGIVGTEVFDNIEAAERTMRKWARFGVVGYCSDPDRIWIASQDGQVLKIWDWQTGAPTVLTNQDPTSQGSA